VNFYEKTIIIDLIYDKVDRMMTNGEFEELSNWIGDIKPKFVDPDISISILTSSLPAKTKIKSRSDFFDQTKDLLCTHPLYEFKMDLLKGLE